eukprot:scaffold3070_cov133-Isochrysis_galbana.AAC.4
MKYNNNHQAEPSAAKEKEDEIALCGCGGSCALVVRLAFSCPAGGFTAASSSESSSSTSSSSDESLL